MDPVEPVNEVFALFEAVLRGIAQMMTALVHGFGGGPLSIILNAVILILVARVYYGMLRIVFRVMFGFSSSDRRTIEADRSRRRQQDEKERLAARRALGLEPPATGIAPEVWISKRYDDILDGTITEEAEREARVAWSIEMGMDPDELDDLKRYDPWKPINPE